jgi:SagB-type dehydrogenase family enzyme
MPAKILLLLREGEQVPHGLTPGVGQAIRRLARGGSTEAEMEGIVIDTDGAAGLPLLYFALHSVARNGGLQYRVAGDDGTLATATCRSRLELREPSAAARYTLSRFALMRRDGNRFVFETSLSEARITIEDERVLSIALPDRKSDLSPDESLAVRTLFRACSMLTEEGEDEGPLAYWSFNDLLFHSRTRLGRHHGEYGGSFPFRGRTEPLPAVKPAMSDDVVVFEPPHLHGEFTSVVENRRSSRTFGDRPLTRGQLGEFLYRSARVKEISDAGTGQQVSRRPYPGGGAVYELEVYASVRDCIGVSPGLYHYCPLEHRLERIGNASEELLRHATQPAYEAPDVLLTIAARFGRVFWKYESVGYALILKDVGALMQTFYLVAEAMGLGACAIGGGDSDLFARAAGLDYYAETSVGEFIIGSRAEAES